MALVRRRSLLTRSGLIMLTILPTHAQSSMCFGTSTTLLVTLVTSMSSGTFRGTSVIPSPISDVHVEGHFVSV